ncbi:hypothetical protein GCM10010182_63370 [Actinomadura cremea]|nr:hypothetical protein GCM10010182_63370 [Actinomadura cremea]
MDPDEHPEDGHAWNTLADRVRALREEARNDPAFEATGRVAVEGGPVLTGSLVTACLIALTIWTELLKHPHTAPPGRRVRWRRSAAPASASPSPGSPSGSSPAPT